MTRFALLVSLTLFALFGCDGTEMDLGDNGLAGDWIRIGYPACEGTLPLQDLPVERRFIYADRMTIEQDGNNLRFTTNVEGEDARGFEEVQGRRRRQRPPEVAIPADSKGPFSDVPAYVRRKAR